VTLRTRYGVTGAILLACLTGVHAQKKDPLKHLNGDHRIAVIQHAQVWASTDIASVDIKAGPMDVAAYAPEDTIECEYVARRVTGTPKFWCDTGRRTGKDSAKEDSIKVKYGEANGEVYGEVAATRLLWALGFGADRMFPVKVLCHGCATDPINDQHLREGEHLFDPAAVERPFPGKEVESSPDSGWGWNELNLVDQTSGGAPLAHRDALRLLAVFMQHTDNKPRQQRLVCQDAKNESDADSVGGCEHPFMMLNDVGRTFGKANMFNKDLPGSVDLKAWASMPIWKGKTGCVGNLPKSWTGSLEDPRISEGGRAFLANLLSQLSDAQLHDLFEVARFARRQPETTVDEWVEVFKQKRAEIVSRSCAT